MKLQKNIGNNPLVSVIIPTYNRKKMVQEAIASVLNQTYPQFELIVVDDGSTDETTTLMKPLLNRIKYIFQSNKGVSAARNRGIHEARGDYIAFLDSDDLWKQDKLEKQVQFFNTHPQALICQTEETWMRNGVQIFPKTKHQKASGNFFNRSLMLCLVSPSAVMIKKHLFQIVGVFDEDLPACEDYDLWLRIGCIYPIYLLDEPLITKRGGHPDQLSQNPCLDKYRIQSMVNLIKTGKLSQNQLSETIKVLHNKCLIYAKGCHKRGKLKEGDFYLGMASEYGQIMYS